mgnify:CR=1 FL=1
MGKHQKEKRETEDSQAARIEVGGVVIEKFPGGMFSVELEQQKQLVLAHLDGFVHALHAWLVGGLNTAPPAERR